MKSNIQNYYKISGLKFNSDPEFSDKESLSVYQKLIHLYLEKSQDTFVKALHSWFENKNIKQLEHTETPVCSYLKIIELLNEQFLWNQKNKIIFTPTIIINGYHFPKEYDRNDLIYFINDMEEDEDFIFIEEERCPLPAILSLD